MTDDTTPATNADASVDADRSTGRWMFAGALLGVGIGLSAGVVGSVVAGVIGATAGHITAIRLVRAERDVPADSGEPGSRAVGADSGTTIAAGASSTAAGEGAGVWKFEPLSDGDFVVLEYTPRTVEGGNVVDTTRKADAPVDAPADEFGPRTVVLGAGHIFEPVEDALRGQRVGHESSVIVPAEEAFGEYDPTDVHTVPIGEIPEEKRTPGATVEVDGIEGRVQEIQGDEVHVDCNHPLAGEALEYDYEIVDRITSPREQARALIELYTGVEVPVSIETDDAGTRTLYVEDATRLTANRQWQIRREEIVDALLDHVGVDEITVRETLSGREQETPGDDDVGLEEIREFLEDDTEQSGMERVSDTRDEIDE